MQYLFSITTKKWLGINFYYNNIVNELFFFSKNRLLFDLFQGQFKVVYKAITRCHVKASNDIQLNLYLSKKSANTTEIRGNLTLIMPLDDSWTVSSLNINKLTKILFLLLINNFFTHSWCINKRYFKLIFC